MNSNLKSISLIIIKSFNYATNFKVFNILQFEFSLLPLALISIMFLTATTGFCSGFYISKEINVGQIAENNSIYKFETDNKYNCRVKASRRPFDPNGIAISILNLFQKSSKTDEYKPLPASVIDEAIGEKSLTFDGYSNNNLYIAIELENYSLKSAFITIYCTPIGQVTKKEKTYKNLQSAIGAWRRPLNINSTDYVKSKPVTDTTKSDTIKDKLRSQINKLLTYSDSKFKYTEIRSYYYYNKINASDTPKKLVNIIEELHTNKKRPNEYFYRALILKLGELNTEYNDLIQELFNQAGHLKLMDFKAATEWLNTMSNKDAVKRVFPAEYFIKSMNLIKTGCSIDLHRFSRVTAKLILEEAFTHINKYSKCNNLKAVIVGNSYTNYQYGRIAPVRQVALDFFKERGITAIPDPYNFGKLIFYGMHR